MKAHNVYLSGPISLGGKATEDEVARNLLAFQTTAQTIEALHPDVVVYSPHTITGDTWDECMRKTLTMMMQCDEIILLDGWQHSKGARVELHLAHELHMSISLVSEWV